MSQQTIVKNNGLGLGSLLFLLFLTLKLTGVIAWSWWWVTAPLWIPFLIFILAILVLILGAWAYHLTHK